jgi:hypothetical protein
MVCPHWPMVDGFVHPPYGSASGWGWCEASVFAVADGEDSAACGGYALLLHFKLAVTGFDQVGELGVAVEAGVEVGSEFSNVYTQRGH